jgi:hypothetical protein
MHLVENLFISSVSFYWVLKVYTYPKKRPVCFICTRFISSSKIWYSNMNLSTNNSLKPPKWRLPSPWAFAHSCYSTTPMHSLTKVNRFKDLIVLHKFWTS